MKERVLNFASGKEEDKTILKSINRGWKRYAHVIFNCNWVDYHPQLNQTHYDYGTPTNTIKHNQTRFTFHIIIRL